MIECDRSRLLYVFLLYCDRISKKKKKNCQRLINLEIFCSVLILLIFSLFNLLSVIF